MNSQTTDHLLTKLCEIIIGICSVRNCSKSLNEALDVLTKTTFLFNEENIQLIIDAGTLNCLTELLLHEHQCVQKYSLQVLSDIVSSSDEHTQNVLDSNILDYFPMLLNHENREIKEMTASCLINITSGLREHKRVVINSEVPQALTKALANSETEMKKMILDIFGNVLSEVSAIEIKNMLKFGIIKSFHEVLRYDGKEDTVNVSTTETLKFITLTVNFKIIL